MTESQLKDTILKSLLDSTNQWSNSNMLSNVLGIDEAQLIKTVDLINGEFHGWIVKREGYGNDMAVLKLSVRYESEVTLFIHNGGFEGVYRKSHASGVLEDETQRLNLEKLRYDVKNSKRMYRTYWWTFSFAVGGFVFGAISLAINLTKAPKGNIEQQKPKQNVLFFKDSIATKMKQDHTPKK